MHTLANLLEVYFGALITALVVEILEDVFADAGLIQTPRQRQRESNSHFLAFSRTIHANNIKQRHDGGIFHQG